MRFLTTVWIQTFLNFQYFRFKRGKFKSDAGFELQTSRSLIWQSTIWATLGQLRDRSKSLSWKQCYHLYAGIMEKVFIYYSITCLEVFVKDFFFLVSWDTTRSYLWSKLPIWKTNILLLDWFFNGNLMGKKVSTYTSSRISQR